MAGGRIKGITVEIGGDTTKLQTALKGVNTETVIPKWPHRRIMICFDVIMKAIACYLLQSMIYLSQNKKGDDWNENNQHQIRRFNL